MTLLMVGLVIFLGMHSISIVAPAWRDAQVARRGEKAWKGIFAALSLVGFVLLLYGYGLARHATAAVYAPPTAMRHLALLLMLPVFPLLLAAFRPGRIQRATKHPMLLAVIFWALAHLLANGTLADVLLFGGFLVWATVDRIAVKRRAVEHQVRTAPPSKFNDLIAVVGGLAIYAAFIMGVHRWLIGVSPLG